MADSELTACTDEETLLLTQRKERKELQGLPASVNHPLQPELLLRQVNEARANGFDATKACGVAVQQVLQAFSEAYGCPVEFVLFPLLACCAGCMGSTCTIQMLPEWNEPPVLWSAVAAPHGSRKTALVKKLQHTLLEVQREASTIVCGSTTTKLRGQIVLDQFSPEGLHALLQENRQVVGIYEDLQTFRNAFPEAEQHKCLATLYDSMAWGINTRKYRALVDRPCVSIASFCEPLVAAKLINEDADFQELFLFSFPAVHSDSVTHDLSVVPSPLDLKKVFHILYSVHHSRDIVYEFSNDAKQLFIQFYQELWSWRNSAENEMESKILTKACGQLLRLSGIVCALEGAFEMSAFDRSSKTLQWHTCVSALHVWRAKQILDYCVMQKFIILNSDVGSCGNYRASGGDVRPKLDQDRVESVAATVVAEPTVICSNGQVEISAIGLSPQHNPTSSQMNTPQVVCVSPQSSEPSTYPYVTESLPKPMMVREAVYPVSYAYEEDSVSSANADIEDFIQKYRYKIKKLLEHKSSELTASRAVQLKICPKDAEASEMNGNSPRYTVAIARLFLDKIASFGFADIEERTTMNGYATKRRTYVWRKRKIQILKHGVSKGDKKRKKEIAEEVARLEAELNDRHEKELAALQLGLNDQINSRETIQAVSTTAHLMDEMTIVNPPCDKSVKGIRTSKAQKRRDKKAERDKEREDLIAQQELKNLSGVRNLEAEKLKEILRERHQSIYEIPSDGNCLYVAIEHQLQQQGTETSYTNLRQQTSTYMADHPDEFLPFLTDAESGEPMDSELFQRYCHNIASTTVWGGHVELQALSQILNLPIHILQADGPVIKLGDEHSGPPITLSYHRHAYSLGEHYNSIIPEPPNEDDEFQQCLK